MKRTMLLVTAFLAWIMATQASDALLKAADISVKQGYHTVGRNEDKALLLRISIPFTLHNPPSTIYQLGITLKGNTCENISQLSIYQSDNQSSMPTPHPDCWHRSSPKAAA